MSVSRLVAALVVLWASQSGTPEAAPRCLSAAETRKAIASGRVVPLARIRQAIRRRGLGEVIRVKLCRRGRLVYVITVLSANGKVRKLTIGARTGSMGRY